MPRPCNICGQMVETNAAEVAEYVLCGGCIGQPQMGPIYVIRSRSTPQEIANKIREMIRQGVILPWDRRFLPPEEETFEPYTEWFPGKDENDDD